MAIYARGRRRWRVVIWHKNHRHEWIVRGSHDAAESWESEQRLALEAADPLRGRAPTFSAFCVGRYKPHARTHLAPRTWSNREYTLRTLHLHFGELPLDKIDTEAVDRYIGARQKDGILPGTINTELNGLRAVLTFARAVKIRLPSLKIRNVRAPRGSRRVRAWSDEQLAKLFEALADKKNRAAQILPLVVFLANTGCRRGEALALRWESVDLDAGRIWVEPSEEWQPKDDEPREVPLSAALRPWLERLKAENEKRRKPSPFVFVTRKGTPYAYWPQNTFDRVRERAGLEGGPHTLRHTYASHFLRARPDLWMLSKILGHSHGRTTELYAHLLPGGVRAAADAVAIAPGVGPAEAAAMSAWTKNRGATRG